MHIKYFDKSIVNINRETHNFLHLEIYTGCLIQDPVHVILLSVSQHFLPEY